MRVRSCIALGILGLLTVSGSASADGSVEVPAGPIDLALLQVGDTVALGSLAAGEDGSEPACAYPPFQTVIRLPPGIESIGVDMENVVDGQQCSLVVTDLVSVAGFGTAQVCGAAKEVTARTFMYGWGGKWDDLTAVTTSMVFSWDDTCSSARQVRNHIAVDWSRGTGWSNDNFFIDNAYTVLGPADAVYAGGRGWFHWRSNQYVHDIMAQPWGDEDGNAQCFKDYHGTIVRGVSKTCKSVWANPGDYTAMASEDLDTATDVTVGGLQDAGDWYSGYVLSLLQ